LLLVGLTSGHGSTRTRVSLVTNPIAFQAAVTEDSTSSVSKLNLFDLFDPNKVVEATIRHFVSACDVERRKEHTSSELDKTRDHEIKIQTRTKKEDDKKDTNAHIEQRVKKGT
jgi:hypothetical protein